MKLIKEGTRWFDKNFESGLSWGLYTREGESEEKIKELLEDQFNLFPYYYGPGQPYAKDLMITATRTKVLVEQLVGMDV